MNKQAPVKLNTLDMSQFSNGLTPLDEDPSLAWEALLSNLESVEAAYLGMFPENVSEMIITNVDLKPKETILAILNKSEMIYKKENAQNSVDMKWDLNTVELLDRGQSMPLENLNSLIEYIQSAFSMLETEKAKLYLK